MVNNDESTLPILPTIHNIDDISGEIIFYYLYFTRFIVHLFYLCLNWNYAPNLKINNIFIHSEFNASRFAFYCLILDSNLFEAIVTGKIFANLYNSQCSNSLQTRTKIKNVLEIQSKNSNISVPVTWICCYILLLLSWTKICCSFSFNASEVTDKLTISASLCQFAVE